LERLGANLAVARLRRRESLASWASRLGVSIPTLMRVEAGEPGVGIGIYAQALWLIGCDGHLAELAAPASDRGALAMDVRAAEALGRSRAKAAANAKLTRIEKQRQKEGLNRMIAASERMGLYEAEPEGLPAPGKADKSKK
jgi:transcriptional regulator with XRE-family HTH domain